MRADPSGDVPGLHGSLAQANSQVTRRLKAVAYGDCKRGNDTLGQNFQTNARDVMAK